MGYAIAGSNVVFRIGFESTPSRPPSIPPTQTHQSTRCPHQRVLTPLLCTMHQTIGSRLLDRFEFVDIGDDHQPIHTAPQDALQGVPKFEADEVCA